MRACKRKPETLNKMSDEKVSTIFLFRNLGTNLQRLIPEEVEALGDRLFSFRTVGVWILGEHYQITEVLLRASLLVSDPDTKPRIEKVRSRYGVTSLGEGPSPGNTMLAFESRTTMLTYDWTDLKMPLQIEEKCFLNVGEEKVSFPVSCSPVTYLINGFNPGLNTDSAYHLNDKHSILLRAKFRNGRFSADDHPYPFMYSGQLIPTSIRLDLSFLDHDGFESTSDKIFIITKVRVELQEFSIVPSLDSFISDVRSVVLLEKKAYRAMCLSTQPSVILGEVWDCNLPDLGPTFYTHDFIRSYALKVSLTIAHKEFPDTTVSAFIEFNIASRVEESIKEMDKPFAPQSFPGCIVKQGTFDLFLEDSSALSLAHAERRQKTSQDNFQRYIILYESKEDVTCNVYAKESKGSFDDVSYLSGKKTPKGLDKTCNVLEKEITYSLDEETSPHLGLFKRVASKARNWLARRNPLSSSSKCFDRASSRSSPILYSASGDVESEASLSQCIVSAEQVERETSLRPTSDLRKLYPIQTFCVGVEKVPLLIDVTINYNKYSSPSPLDKIGSVVKVRPGTKLARILQIRAMVAKSSNYRIQESVQAEVQFESLEVVFEEKNYRNMEQTTKETLLLDSKCLPVVALSCFDEPLFYAPANAFKFPQHLFGNSEIPLDVQSTHITPEHARVYRLRGRLLFSSQGCTHTAYWHENIYIAPPDHDPKVINL